MFSGIIEQCGTIAELERRKNSLYVLIECQYTDLKEGESVAVDGICLTAVNPKSKAFYCDISSETIHLTTAQEFQVGRKVNLERALCLGDRIGGHLVGGHVDQCGIVKDRVSTQEFLIVTVAGIVAENMPYLIKKGSIAVNGVSLTLNQIFNDSFELMLIPHTLAVTNLKQLKSGDKVNLEFDGTVKTIVNTVREYLKNDH